MIRKKNKPIKVKKTDLDEAEVLLIVEEWGKGQGVEETKHKLLLPDSLIEGVYNDCDTVQDKCTELMSADPQPLNENKLVRDIELLGIANSDEMVEAIIKYSDVDNDGDWDMYKSYDWGE